MAANERIAALITRLKKLRQEREQAGTTDLPRYLAASDLHGNVERLKEILAVARRKRISKVFLVGDIYSGPGGWAMYELLKPLVDSGGAGEVNVVPMWGNHELAFVVGMLGNDRQLRFFYGFGGRELIEGLNCRLAAAGCPVLRISGGKSPTREDLEAIRACPELIEFANWIKSTHRLFARDEYGTGYMHACPRINRQGHLNVQYAGVVGVDALEVMERDLRDLDRASHPVVSALLQTDTSPVWALADITSTRQFQAAFDSAGVRRLVFGHRHLPLPVNVRRLNRQIGIAVDFDKGLGGFLIIDTGGLTFYDFVDQDSHRTETLQLIAAAGNLDARQTFLADVEEFFVRQLIKEERAFFESLPATSSRYREEFEALEKLREEGFPWTLRLYVELYGSVKDVATRIAMFTSAVKSSDEEAFRSMIHQLFHMTRELAAYGQDWYAERYRELKADVEAIMGALREMPLRRLGLLDLRMRGTTSRFNLLDLYRHMLELPDPDLAVMGVENLGALQMWEADQELRAAFFHDVRRVRVRAAVALAARGEVAYPLVASLLGSRDNWVRFLSVWTIAEIGMTTNDAVRQQAIKDISVVLARETDWLIATTAKELLRKLRAPNAEAFPPPQEIPNLTDMIVETLQMIVDSQYEPFRKMFKVYFITVAISSLVYRRGLIGLDIDELKIYVNRADYFPPHFRTYKSGDRDREGNWRGWRRLWIRGETLNRPDAPKIIELSKDEADKVPTGHHTVVLYNHLEKTGRVTLPDLNSIINQYGLGKVKDRVRHWMMEHWDDAFNDQQRGLLSRLHAAAVIKMLFNLPSEVYLTSNELDALKSLAQPPAGDAHQLPKPLLSLRAPADDESFENPAGRPHTIVLPNWLDAIKFPVAVYLID